MMWPTITWRRWVQTAVSFFSAAFSLLAKDINPVGSGCTASGTGRIHRQHCSMNPRRPQIVSGSVSHFHDGAVWVSVDDRRWRTPSEEDGCHYSLVRRRTSRAFISNDAHKITWILIKPFRTHSDAFIPVKDVIFSCRRCSHLFLYFTSQHANALGQ